MRRFALLPFASCLLPLLNGCAKSPSGGPTVRATNRFQTTLTLAGTLNPAYYYAIAFDDTGDSSRGPVAIDGNTPILNGVMGGSFRLLVLYHQNAFRVFYRPTPNSAGSEEEILGATNLFNTGQVPHVTTNGIDVTINLDAQFTSGPMTGTYIFPHAADAAGTQRMVANSFDLNVAATNTVLRGGSSNNLIKPVDAFGAQTLSTPVKIQDLSTHTTSVSDAIADENLGVDTTYSDTNSRNYVPFQNIDVTSLQIGITRF
jgi:hypothetical protein